MEDSTRLETEIISFMGRQQEINKNTSRAITEMTALHRQNSELLTALNTKQESCLLAQQARNDPSKHANRIAIASIVVAGIVFAAPPVFSFIRDGQLAIKEQKLLLLLDKRNSDKLHGAQ